MRVKSAILLLLILFALVSSGAVHYGHIRLSHCRSADCHASHSQPRDEPARQKPDSKNQSSCQICQVWQSLGKTLLLDATGDTPPDQAVYPALTAGQLPADPASSSASQPRAPPR